MITIKIVGNEKVSKMMLNLGPQLNKMINKVAKEFLTSVKKGAQIRAPKLTGALSRSMEVRQTSQGNWIFAVGEGLQHALPREIGFKPHLVSSSAMAYPGQTIAQVYGIPEGITLFVASNRKKNFVRDSFQAAIPRLPQILSKSTKEAIAKSR